MEKSKVKLSVRLTESAMMIALATILSLFKLVDLPYGGSVTLASMLPVLLIAYRYGTSWGLFTGVVYGAIELVLGTSSLSYVTGAASVAAVIILDFILAFGVIGLGGLTRGVKNQKTGLVLGALIACVARYACHVISGATVWAGLSIPTGAALSYSFVYNATYMLPETIVLIIVAFYIGSALDFRAPKLTPLKKEDTENGVSLSAIISGALCGGALIFDIASVFGKLQNADDGTFDITGINDVNWIPVIAVTCGAVLLSAVAYFIVKSAKKK